jgi:hypothetical protein
LDIDTDRERPSEERGRLELPVTIQRIAKARKIQGRTLTQSLKRNRIQLTPLFKTSNLQTFEIIDFVVLSHQFVVLVITELGNQYNCMK